MNTQALREQIEGYLDVLAIPHAPDLHGTLTVTHGTAAICVVPYTHEEFALVRLLARTNAVELSDELSRYLLRQNAKLEIGGFAWETPGRVALSYTLFAEFLQRRELEVALSAVASNADHYNEEIRARFGGELLGKP